MNYFELFFSLKNFVNLAVSAVLLGRAELFMQFW